MASTTFTAIPLLFVLLLLGTAVLLASAHQTACSGSGLQSEDPLSPCQVACNNSARAFPDAAVIAAQRPYAIAWKTHFNQGDFTYCGNAYLEDAVMYANLGPAADFLKQKVGLPNPTVMRGRDNIMAFWETGIKTIGLADFQAYDDSGYYADQVFVVNDNKVIVQSNFTMNAVAGAIHAETWVRVNDSWLLETDFFEIRAMLV